MLFLYGFFFKQKTAYDMRISDWSSEVCSSDLSRARSSVRSFRREVFQAASASIGFVRISLDGFCRFGGRAADGAGLTQHQVLRIGHHGRQIAVDRTTIIARRAAVQVRFLRVAPIRTAWHAGHRAADDDANRSAGEAARSHGCDVAQ